MPDIHEQEPFGSHPPPRKKPWTPLEAQRCYPRGIRQPDELQIGPDNICTLQEFFVNGFSSIDSMNTCTTWRELLASSPSDSPHIPYIYDGGNDDEPQPPTPPEIRNALHHRRKKSTVERVVSIVTLGNYPKSPEMTPIRKVHTHASGDALKRTKTRPQYQRVGLGLVQMPTSPKAPKAPKTPKKDRSPVAERKGPNSKGKWASRTKRFFGLERKQSHVSVKANVDRSSGDGGALGLFESSIESHSSRRRLLDDKPAVQRPAKITLRRPSNHPEQLVGSFAMSEQSSSLSSLGNAAPVSGWTFLGGNGPTLPTLSSESSLAVPPLSPPPEHIPVPGSGPVLVPATDNVNNGAAHTTMEPLARQSSRSNGFNGPLIDANSIGIALGHPSQVVLTTPEPRASVTDSVTSHETLWRRSFSDPILSTSSNPFSGPVVYTSHHTDPAWERRDSSAPSVETRHASVMHSSLSRRASPIPEEGQTSIKPPKRSQLAKTRVNDVPTHQHVNQMFNEDGHANSFRTGHTASPVPRAAAKTAPLPTSDGAKPRKPSIVKKDHTDIYQHPYFNMNPHQRQGSFASAQQPHGNGRPSIDYQRRETTDTIASYKTAHDGNGADWEWE